MSSGLLRSERKFLLFKVFHVASRNKLIVRNIVVSPVHSWQPTKERRSVGREQVRLSGSIRVTAVCIVFHFTLWVGRNVRRLGMRGSHREFLVPWTKTAGRTTKMNFAHRKTPKEKKTSTLRVIYIFFLWKKENGDRFSTSSWKYH